MSDAYSYYNNFRFHYQGLLRKRTGQTFFIIENPSHQDLSEVLYATYTIFFLAIYMHLIILQLNIFIYLALKGPKVFSDTTNSTDQIYQITLSNIFGSINRFQKTALKMVVFRIVYMHMLTGNSSKNDISVSVTKFFHQQKQ